MLCEPVENGPLAGAQEQNFPSPACRRSEVTPLDHLRERGAVRLGFRRQNAKWYVRPPFFKIAGEIPSDLPGSVKITEAVFKVLLDDDIAFFAMLAQVEPLNLARFRNTESDRGIDYF